MPIELFALFVIVGSVFILSSVYYLNQLRKIPEGQMVPGLHGSMLNRNYEIGLSVVGIAVGIFFLIESLLFI